jgi:prepilin-type processing-associated H-X9-DG protein
MHAVLFLLAVATQTQTPVDCIKKFATALNNKDGAAAAKLVSGGDFRPGDFADVTIFSKLHTSKRWSITVEIGDFTTSTWQATISCRTTVASENQRQASKQTESETIQLSKRGSTWLIEPQTDGRDIGPETPLQFAAWALTWDSRQKTACLSNLKRLAIGCLEYADQHGHSLDFSATDFATKLSRAELRRLKCPCNSGSAYIFNERLRGINLAKVREPSSLVMLFDGDGTGIKFRHQGLACVAYADGHVRLISEKNASTVRWSP